MARGKRLPPRGASPARRRRGAASGHLPRRQGRAPPPSHQSRQEAPQAEDPVAAEQHSSSDTSPTGATVAADEVVQIIGHTEGSCLFVDNRDALSTKAARRSFEKLARSGHLGLRSLAVAFRRQKCRGVSRQAMSYLFTYIKTYLEEGLRDNFEMLQHDTQLYGSLPATMRRQRCAPLRTSARLWCM